MKCKVWLRCKRILEIRQSELHGHRLPQSESQSCQDINKNRSTRQCLAPARRKSQMRHMPFGLSDAERGGLHELG